MLVKDYALRQLHWMLQKDPWIEAVMTAGGVTLDALADRIVAIYNAENFDELPIERVRYYERLLDLEQDENKALPDRRAAIQAAYNIAQKPSLETMQSICDAWQAGGVICSYTPGELTLKFIGDVGVPANIQDLKNAIIRAVPAHIYVDYAYRYLLIREVHNVMTLAELNATPLSSFAGGT